MSKTCSTTSQINDCVMALLESELSNEEKTSVLEQLRDIELENKDNSTKMKELILKKIMRNYDGKVLITINGKSMYVGKNDVFLMVTMFLVISNIKFFIDGFTKYEVQDDEKKIGNIVIKMNFVNEDKYILSIKNVSSGELLTLNVNDKHFIDSVTETVFKNCTEEEKEPVTPECIPKPTLCRSTNVIESIGSGAVMFDEFFVESYIEQFGDIPNYELTRILNCYKAKKDKELEEHAKLHEEQVKNAALYRTDIVEIIKEIHPSNKNFYLAVYDKNKKYTSLTKIDDKLVFKGRNYPIISGKSFSKTLEIYISSIASWIFESPYLYIQMNYTIYSFSDISITSEKSAFRTYKSIQIITEPDNIDETDEPEPDNNAEEKAEIFGGGVLGSNGAGTVPISGSWGWLNPEVIQYSFDNIPELIEKLDLLYQILESDNSTAGIETSNDNALTLQPVFLMLYTIGRILSYQTPRDLSDRYEDVFVVFGSVGNGDVVIYYSDGTPKHVPHAPTFHGPQGSQGQVNGEILGTTEIPETTYSATQVSNDSFKAWFSQLIYTIMTEPPDELYKIIQEELLDKLDIVN